MISTEGDLIDALGGNRPVGVMLFVKENTVCGWRKRGFPPWTHGALKRAARARRLQVDDSMFEIRRPGSQRAA